MQLVYPPEGHQTYEQSTFFIGAVAPGARLTLNQSTTIALSEKGFFAHSVSLEPGENHFELTAQLSNGETETQARTLIMKPALDLSQLPQEVSKLQAFLYPQADIGIQAGESLLLVCPAPPNSTVYCRLDPLMSQSLQMSPVSAEPDNRTGIFAQLHHAVAPWSVGALYVLALPIDHDTPPVRNLRVEYTIEFEGEQLVINALGKVTITPFEKHQYATVIHPETVVRTLPYQGARETPLLLGTTVQSAGFFGNWAQLQYMPNKTVWVSAQHLQYVTDPVYPTTVPIHLIQTSSSLRAFQVIIPMSRLVPLEVRLEEDRIYLTLYGAVSQCDFIHYHQDALDKGLYQIHWRQLGTNTMEIEIQLYSPLFGFERYYDAQQRALVCAIRTEHSIESLPFVVAIDPGHGGEEAGSTAPEGTPEKTLNLQMALKLKQRLSQMPNVKVVLTREEDETVSLEERVHTAIMAEANLLLSLHHNALPDGRNPLAESGVSTFYYHPFAMSFAKRFQETLVKNTAFRNYGILYDSLFMCRVMEMPALLLELGFLTHPEDAALCLDETHQDKVVQALVNSINICLPSPQL